MKEIHEKLAIWSKLSKQCQVAQAHLVSANSAGSNRAQAELLELKARTQAAFKDAQNAIQSSERAGATHPGLRRQSVSQKTSASAHPK